MDVSPYDRDVVQYDEVAAAIAPTGMVARGAFTPELDDAVPTLPGGGLGQRSIGRYRHLLCQVGIQD